MNSLIKPLSILYAFTYMCVCVSPGLAVATLTSSVRTEGQSRARLVRHSAAVSLCVLTAV